MISLVNKKIVNSNPNLKIVQRIEKRNHGKGSRKNLKNYIGKVITLSSNELIGKETRISNYVDDITTEALLLAIEKSGVTGMSGNGFSIYEKIKSFLASASNRRLLLINAVECDPGLVHDEWLLANRYKEITRCIHYLKQSLCLQEIILATKSKTIKPNNDFSVVKVPPRYPMGEEHFLIQQTLGINLAKNEIPALHGILILNLQSIYQICKIINSCYDFGRFITVADLSKGRAKIAYVYPEDNIANLLIKEFENNNAMLIYKGHGIMSSVIAENTENFSYNGNFAAYAQAPNISNANKCRKCGVCTRRCPANVKVDKIVQALDNKHDHSFSSFHPENCIHCGSCTYFCRRSMNVAGYVSEALKNETKN